MKKQNTFLAWFILLMTISITVFSCKKPVDEFPNSDEAISFAGIDSTTITMKAGEELELDVVLITDTIIDSLKIGYFIDTIGLTTNLTYADINTQLVSTGFEEVNNKFIYNASLLMPANAYGIRAFRPFKNNIGDYVRIIFRMEAGSRSYEKQLKVIIEP